MLSLFQAHARRRKAKRVPRPRLPVALEENMVRTLQIYVRQIHDIIEREIFPILPEYARADAFGDDRSPLGRFNRAEKLVRETLSTGELDKAVRFTAQGVARFANRETSRVLGVALIDHEAFRPLVERSVETSVGLIRSIAHAELDRVESTILGAASQGLRVEELAGQIKGLFGASDSRAELIARDQTLKLNADVNQARQVQAGVASYTWSTSKDSRVREDHQALEGKEIGWNAPPIVDSKTGRREHAGKDYQCRCVAIPVIGSVT